MKNIIRLPLDQFAYLETEFTGTPDEALVEYKRLVNEFKNPSVSQENALSVKDWQRCLDNYLITNSISEEDITNMSDRQRLLINEIKKSLARISSKDETLKRKDNINRK